MSKMYARTLMVTGTMIGIGFASRHYGLVVLGTGLNIGAIVIVVAVALKGER